MLKKAKWVKPSQAGEPISRVAADVIRERLEMVWQYAPLAAKKWEDDPEFLHQLRVGTRRSAAALITFAELLPEKKTRHMHKRLKRLRKASGEARDLDVLTDRLRAEVKGGRKDLSPAVERLRDLRRDAQATIVKAVDKLVERDFSTKIEALCDRIRWRGEGPEPTYAEESRRLLCCEVESFFAAAAADVADNEALHALRIRGKQLRYTMEVLAGAFDSTFRGEVYPQLRELQDKLGQINDHAAAGGRFLTWAEVSHKDVASQFELLAADETHQAAQKRADFFQWWSQERSANLEEKLRQVAVATIER